MAATFQDPTDGLRGPVRRLTVLYDERCGTCRRWASWLGERRFHVPVELLAAGSDEARARYPHVEPWLGRELVAVDDRARAWIGSPAFVMCLWATARYRPTAWFASRRVFAPAANAFFRHLSDRRHRAEPPPTPGFECDDGGGGLFGCDADGRS